jgi:ferrochelatase
MSRPVDAVLLIAFGGPTARPEIRPFLANVTKGRPIPAERIEEVAHHYELIGGCSPLNELTFRQAQALQALLRRDGPDLPVYVGMRNWTPYLQETLAEMAEKRVRRAIGLILSSFQAEASWRRYQDDVAEARLRVGPLAPEIEYASPWFDREGFIEAMAERVKEALGQIPPADRPGARLIFTAHSIPTAMAEVSPYASQFVLASRLTASRVGHAEWSIAYQSRSGSPRESWLEPDIAKVIRECAREGARHVVAAPIGFVCDHVEILYDLDVEARRVAETSGVSFLRAAAVNDHPAFICMLRDLVVRASEN